MIAQIDITQFNYKKYLIISELDEKWGFYVNDTGFTIYPKDSEYPAKGHPGSHMFSWETGRILNEYHLVLISEGSGIFESKSAGEKKIQSGDAFLLFPGEWHRYKPLKETGWTEFWVGFSGKLANQLMNDIFFKKENPIVSNFNNQMVSTLFKILRQLIEEEPFGFQRTASGICIQLMAEFCNTIYGSDLKHKSPISRAKQIMNRKIDEEIDFNMLARNLGISYSKFRSDFKRQTGLPPLQYFLRLKLEKAKDLLISSSLTSQEIAQKIGFESDFYFCRVFKNKIGLSPQMFRKSNLIRFNSDSAN